MTMTISSQRPAAWWKEPMVWLIITLPACAVIGGIITVWIAARDPDPLVAEDYYKQGMAIGQVVERDARARALDLSGELRVNQGQLRITLTGKLHRYPDRLTLRVVHPTRAQQDLYVTLAALSPGEYRGKLPPLEAGQRRFILEPQEREWRITGRGGVPLVDAVPLGVH